jgi:hypothetical protein
MGGEVLARRSRASSVCVAAPLVALLIACGESRRDAPSDSRGVAGSSSGARAGAPDLGGTGGSVAGGVGGEGGVGAGAAGGREASGGQAAGGASGGMGAAPAAGASAAAGAPPLPPIGVQAPSAGAACDPALCTVVGDWDVLESGVHSFHRFRVATSADITYLTLSSFDGRVDRNRLVALDTGGEREVDQGLVPRMSAPFLAVDADGSPHVLGQVAQPKGSGMRAPLVEGTLAGAAWSELTVEDAFRTFGFELGPADRSFVHLEDTTGTMVLATQEGDGAPERAPLPDGVVGSLALDTNGEPFFVSADAAGLSVFDPTGGALLTQPFSEAPAIVPVTAPAGQPPAITRGGSELALALLLGDGLHVVLADRAGQSTLDLPIPSSALPAFPCPSTPPESSNAACGEQCAPTCSFSGSGLAPASRGAGGTSKAFALARTSDGALWLAYVISALELDYTYTMQSGEGGCVFCRANGGVGTQTSVLHVARIAPDGSSWSEAMTVPVEGFVQPSHAGQAEVWAVGARAFGQRVAVAVSQRGTGALGVRVTTFDAVE